MSNHVHLILHSEKLKLSDVLHDFKKFTARLILKSIRDEPESRREWLLQMFAYFAKEHTTDRNFQFWQQDNYPTELWSMPVLIQKMNYIHQNPVRAGIVLQPEHYYYSSASYYLDKTGPIEINELEV
jgi:REP element-mobilizing transposase RayT